MEYFNLVISRAYERECIAKGKTLAEMEELLGAFYGKPVKITVTDYITPFDKVVVPPSKPEALKRYAMIEQPRKLRKGRLS